MWVGGVGHSLRPCEPSLVLVTLMHLGQNLLCTTGHFTLQSKCNQTEVWTSTGSYPKQMTAKNKIYALCSPLNALLTLTHILRESNPSLLQATFFLCCVLGREQTCLSYPTLNYSKRMSLTANWLLICVCVHVNGTLYCMYVLSKCYYCKVRSGNVYLFLDRQQFMASTPI